MLAPHIPERSAILQKVLILAIHQALNHFKNLQQGSSLPQTQELLRLLQDLDETFHKSQNLLISLPNDFNTAHRSTEQVIFPSLLNQVNDWPAVSLAKEVLLAFSFYKYPDSQFPADTFNLSIILLIKGIFLVIHPQAGQQEGLHMRNAVPNDFNYILCICDAVKALDLTSILDPLNEALNKTAVVLVLDPCKYCPDPAHQGRGLMHAVMPQHNHPKSN